MWAGSYSFYICIKVPPITPKTYKSPGAFFYFIYLGACMATSGQYIAPVKHSARNQSLFPMHAHPSPIPCPYPKAPIHSTHIHYKSL